MYILHLKSGDTCKGTLKGLAVVFNVNEEKRKKKERMENELQIEQQRMENELQIEQHASDKA